MYEINSNRMISRLDIRKLMEDTYKQVIGTLKEWPNPGDDAKIIAWVNAKIERWEPHILAVRDYHRLVVLSKVCERCIADLIGKVRDPRKLHLLNQLREPLSKLHDYVDRDGENFRAYEKCDELMDYLYDLIGWE